MNKLIKTTLIVFTIILFSGFATLEKVKVKNSWKSDNFGILKTQKILVINKFKKEGIRQRGERAIADKLREEGYDAVEAFVAFPYLNVLINRTPEEIEDVIRQIGGEGYNSIIITKLKNPNNEPTTTRLTEESKRQETADEKEINKAFNTSSYGKDIIAFGVYYNDPAPAPNRTPGPSGMEETTANYSEDFLLETLTYYFGNNQEQILASISIDITDPDNVMKVLEKYASFVGKQFKMK